MEAQAWRDNFLAPENSAYRAKKLLQPLNSEKKEIRLVELQTGSNDDPIHVKLVPHLSLIDVDVKYYAISYVVGDVLDTREIFVDGYSLNVTVNLTIALRQLRDLFANPGTLRDIGIDSSAPCLLWIDQVSINQDNPVEKGQQVLLMHEIYTAADKVFVSLDNSDGSGDGICALKDIAEHWESLWKPLVEGQGSIDAPMSKEEAQDSTSLGLLHWYFQRLDDPQWAHQKSGLVQLCKLPYWSRCWIYQEFAAASEDPIIMWGSGYFRESLLSQSSYIVFEPHSICLHMRGPNATDTMKGQLQRYLAELEKMSNDKMTMLTSIRSGIRSSNYLPLSDMLQFARHLDCLDARDRVYSMLGLCATKHVIVPNYRPDFSTAMAFRWGVINCALYEKSLNFLNDILEYNDRNRSDLVSWVPDYSVADDDALMFKYMNEDREWNCMKGQPPEVQLRVCGDEQVPSILNVKSIMLHQRLASNELGNIASSETSGSNLLNSWVEMSTYKTRRRKHLFKDYSAERVVIEERPFVQVYSFGHYLKYGESWLRENKTSSNDVREATADVWAESLQVSALVDGWWRFFCLENGVMGMVPWKTQPGDSIALIAGCSLPCVLRQRPHQDGYTFVGSAYVHEYMDGRAVDECGSGQLGWTYVDLY